MRWLFSMVAACTVVTPGFSVTVGDPVSVARIDGHEVHADRLLARFRPDVPADRRQTVLALHEVEERFSSRSIEGLTVLNLKPDVSLNAVVPSPTRDPAAAGRRLNRLIKSLMATEIFEYVEPDYRAFVHVVPSDAAFQDGSLWGLENINAPTAWDVTTGSREVIVGVIDSGVNYRHQDLESQMWVNMDEIPLNGLDDDGDGYVDNVHGINAITGSGDPMDDNLHGTHVAGTIGGSANDAGRIVGVAWEVRIMALKFVAADGLGWTADAIRCIDFAVENGVHILNNSWGSDGFSLSLRDAVRETSDAGILFVASAGNESESNDVTPRYPSSFDIENVISVAAIDRFNQLASFSNYGEGTVHLGAPGVGILSALRDTPTSYTTLSGTSMAAPHVAGAAALLWALDPPGSREAMLILKQQLLFGATATPSLAGRTITGGRLDIGKAIGTAPDDVLELEIVSGFGTNLYAGRANLLFVTVSDLFPVTNATVTASADVDGLTLVFQDDGISPDAAAMDGVHTASIVVPSQLTGLTLAVEASAPGKSTTTKSAFFEVLSTPANDLFSLSEVIDTVPDLRTGSTVDATGEPGEPFHFVGRDSGQPRRSLWWRWTAPHTRPYTISTVGSDFDTVLAVYEGNAITSLVEVASNDNGSFDRSSLVTFYAIKNRTYHFAVDGSPDESEADGSVDTASGGVALRFWENNAMLNNNFSGRTTIPGVNRSVSTHNIGSTAESMEPEHDPSFSTFSSVWWSWTPAVSETIHLSTAGSGIDSVLAVYRGDALGALVAVAANNDVAFPSTLTSELSFVAEAGQVYQIAVDGIRSPDGIARGLVQLHVANRPINDQFEQALMLEGEIVGTTAYTMGATFEAGEPSPTGHTVGRSVWWRWVAPRDGQVILSTDGSNFDTTLGVYTGSTVEALTPVVENDDRVLYTAKSSWVSFDAEAGSTYHIQVDGFAVNDVALAGVVQLTLTMDRGSSLAFPVRRPSGFTTIDLIGAQDTEYTLQTSADLEHWDDVVSRVAVSRELRFSEPTLETSSPRFYRAVPAP